MVLLNQTYLFRHYDSAPSQLNDEAKFRLPSKQCLVLHNQCLILGGTAHLDWQSPPRLQKIGCQISSILSCQEILLFRFLAGGKGWRYACLHHSHILFKL